MNCSRRHLVLLLPLLVAAIAVAQESKGKQKAPPAVLGSKAYEFKDLVKTTNEATKSTRRPVYSGLTTRGEQVSVHITEVEAGEAPHATHQHMNEEIIVVREGTLEVEIGGKAGEFGQGRLTRVGPGSVIFFSSNEVHGWHNVGTTTAQVYIIAGGNRP